MLQDLETWATLALASIPEAYAQYDSQIAVLRQRVEAPEQAIGQQ